MALTDDDSMLERNATSHQYVLLDTCRLPEPQLAYEAYLPILRERYSSFSAELLYVGKEK